MSFIAEFLVAIFIVISGIFGVYIFFFDQLWSAILRFITVSF